MAPTTKVQTIMLPSGYTDGDITTHPPAGDSRLIPDLETRTFYRSLAKLWYVKKGLHVPTGTILEFETLPDGYAVFSCARLDSNHVDRYLYGLRAGRFRSTNEFMPHFEYLMSDGTIQCKCRFCDRKKTVSKMLPGKRSSAGISTAVPGTRPNIRELSTTSNKRKRAIPRGRYIIDHETSSSIFSDSSAPDVSDVEKRWNPVNGSCLDVLFRDLQRLGKLNRTMGSHDNPPSLHLSGTDFDQQCEWNSSKPQWYPRRGDLIFYVEGVNAKTDRLSWDIVNQRFVLNQAGLLDRKPVGWRLGLVVKPPKENSLASMNENEQLFAITPVPDPFSADDANKEVCFVLPRFIRHAAEYVQVLNGMLIMDDCHRSLWLSKRILKSVAPWGQYQFHGGWPKATIMCKGVWIEGELIQIGDVARLRNANDEEVSEVMIVKRIAMHYTLADHDPAGNLQHKIKIVSVKVAVMGKTFSLRPSRRDPRQKAIENLSQLPKPMHGYTWFPVAVDETTVYAENIFGRLYERECYLTMYRRDPGVVQTNPSKLSRHENGKVETINWIQSDVALAQRAGSPLDLGNNWSLFNHRDEQLGINLSKVFRNIPDFSDSQVREEVELSTSSDELGRDGTCL